jgi:hypothetical protein
MIDILFGQFIPHTPVYFTDIFIPKSGKHLLNLSYLTKHIMGKMLGQCNNVIRPGIFPCNSINSTTNPRNRKNKNSLNE